MKLNPRQQKFADEYIKTNNVTQSAIKAGYAENSAHVHGSKLLKNAKVKEYLSKQQEKIQKNTDITIEKVVKAIYEESLTAENSSDRLKANDMLLKHLGGYAPEKRELSGTTIVRNITLNPTKEK